jgi:hypothetical protein
MRAQSVPSPLRGEGKGEGKHAALVTIPFTLCSLLFCSARTRERARVVHRHHPGDLGSRPGKSPLPRSTAHSPSGLSGTGEGNLPVKSPSPRIPARRPGPADTLRRFSAGPSHRGDCFIPGRNVIAVKRNITGDPAELLPLPVGLFQTVFTLGQTA